uniref:Uncharacterized protein n=1 Tax=Rhizophora mucronata TaxID=61149 RepID=A0A2P2QJM0_RHIMU
MSAAIHIYVWHPLNHQTRKSYSRNTYSHWLPSSHCVFGMLHDLI